METKEFNRAVCFTFFESYLEQGKLALDMFGAETCANYFIGLVEYALYKKESTDPVTQMLITGIKNTIDAGQEKRERAFSREDTELTEKILAFIKEHPQATEREIANTLGCSNGKVNKVKQKYGISNKNNNYNTTPNTNTNTNNNTMSMSESKNAVPCPQQKRLLEDLSEEELESLLKKFKKRVKYQELYAEYNLASGTLNKDLELSIQQVRNERKKEKQVKTIHQSFQTASTKDILYLAQHLNCDESEVIDIAVGLGETLEGIKTFFQNHGDVFNTENYDQKYKGDYSTYTEFIKMGIAANTHTYSSQYSVTGF